MSEQESIEDLKRWNEKAKEYASETGTEKDRIWLQFRELFWEALKDVKGKRVLDVGCGHGWLADKIARRGGKVLGIDGSSKLLEIARSKYYDLKFIEYDLIKGLPSLNKKFHYIIANMVLMDIPQISNLIADMRKIIHPNGRFIFTLTHPAFFRQLSDQDKETGQYFRKITGYLDEEQWDIGHNHYHRSLTYYFEILRHNRFVVSRFIEPSHIPLKYNSKEKEEFLSKIPVFLYIEAIPFDI
jgi:2-polyprenyl-3-methyl-5-hydroxy-6-metoxy-1,4-benzoquinol methylase